MKERERESPGERLTWLFLSFLLAVKLNSILPSSVSIMR